MSLSRTVSRCFLLSLGASLSAQAQNSGPPILEPYSIVAPVEFRGEWSRPPAPFLHPIYTRNWLNVRIETVSADSQAVQGRFDMYVRSMCEDLVDEPFTGTFDGQVLRFTYEYQHCPGMKPLVVRLWKDDAGFAGRANRLPFRIQRIIEAAAH